MTDPSQFIDPTQVGLVDDFDVKRGNASRGSIGRAPGVTNYNPDKLQILLEMVQEFVPTNDDEWELVGQKFNQTFHEDRQMKSLKRKFSELVSGGTKTTSHDLTHYVSWAKKLSLRIREKTTGKPFSEPVENSGLMLGAQGEGDDDSSAGGAGLSWGGNALGLTSPSLAPRIRKNRLSAGGSIGGNAGDVQHILSYLQMQSTTNAQNHQQIVGLLQQVLALMQQQSVNNNVSELSPNAAALPVPGAIAKAGGRGRKNPRDEDMDDASVAKKVRKQSEGEEEETN